MQKCFRPCNKLIGSLHEARKWRLASSAAASKVCFLDGSERGATSGSERRGSYDSSATEDYEDSLKNVPDSSSCDESRTEEFNFECFNAAVLTNSTKSEVSTPNGISASASSERHFESVDSDTITAPTIMTATGYDGRASNDSTNSTKIGTNDDLGAFNQNSNNLDRNEANSEVETWPGAKQTQPINSVVSMLGSQSSSLSMGVAKLTDKTLFSRGSAVDCNQHAAAQQPQRGRFIERFKSEASSAVRDALDAGKAALRTTSSSIPAAADASRQRIILSIQRSFGGEQASTGDKAHQGPERRGRQQEYSSLVDDYSRPVRRELRSPMPQLANRRSFSNKFTYDSNETTGWLDARALDATIRPRDKPIPTSEYILIPRAQNRLTLCLNF